MMKPSQQPVKSTSAPTEEQLGTFGKQRFSKRIKTKGVQ
jgi:hypothetical protein